MDHDIECHTNSPALSSERNSTYAYPKQGFTWSNRFEASSPNYIISSGESNGCSDNAGLIAEC